MVAGNCPFGEEPYKPRGLAVLSKFFEGFSLLPFNATLLRKYLEISPMSYDLAQLSLWPQAAGSTRKLPVRVIEALPGDLRPFNQVFPILI